MRRRGRPTRARLLPHLATIYLQEEQLDRFVKHFASPAPSRDVRIIYGRTFLKKRLIEAYIEVLQRVLPASIHRHVQP